MTPSHAHITCMVFTAIIPGFPFRDVEVGTVEPWNLQLLASLAASFARPRNPEEPRNSLEQKLKVRIPKNTWENLPDMYPAALMTRL